MRINLKIIYGNNLPHELLLTTRQQTKLRNEQKGGFLSVLLGTLGASLLQNLLSGKGIVRAGTGNKKGKGIVRAGSGNKKGKGIVRAGTGKKIGFLILPHPLTNFEIQKYYKN